MEKINRDIDYLQLEELLKKPGLVYLLIYSPTCPPCVEMQPVFEWMAGHELSPHKDHFTFVKIDLYKNPQVLGRFIDRDARPWTIVFKDGKKLTEYTGMPANLSMDGFIDSAYKQATGD